MTSLTAATTKQKTSYVIMLTNQMLVHKHCRVILRTANPRIPWVNKQTQPFYGSVNKMVKLNPRITTTTTTTTTTTILQPSRFCPELPGWAGTKEVKPVWIYWSNRVSGNGISLAICISAPCPRHNNASIPPLSFYRPDAFPAAQPTSWKHWRYPIWE